MNTTVQELKATYEQLMTEAQAATKHSKDLDAHVNQLGSDLAMMTYDEYYDKDAYLALEAKLEDAEKVAREAGRAASRKNMAALSALHAWEDAK